MTIDNAALIARLGIKEFWTIREDYKVGDLFWSMGSAYRIQQIVPYPDRPGADLSFLGEDPWVFKCEAGYEITRTKGTENSQDRLEHCPPGYFDRIRAEYGHELIENGGTR